jgi:hypothetical protein
VSAALAYCEQANVFRTPANTPLTAAFFFTLALFLAAFMTVRSDTNIAVMQELAGESTWNNS